jgi:hypothetical protein
MAARKRRAALTPRTGGPVSGFFRVVDLRVIPSPYPGPEDPKPTRTYYSIVAAATWTQGRDAGGSLVLDHVSTDAELVALGDELLVTLHPTLTDVAGDASRLLPLGVRELRNEGGPDGDTYSAYSASFHDQRTEPWADGFLEKGLLTFIAASAGALTPGGCVAIDWPVTEPPPPEPEVEAAPATRKGRG